VAELALIIYLVYGALTFGVRTVIQYRRTGASGVHGVSGEAGLAEWVAGGGFVLALLIGVLAPVLALLEVAGPVAPLDSTAVNVVGLVLALSGVVLTFAAQVAMGESWRIGVDPAERTELVTSGPFALVRNPIFSGMIPTALGLTLMVPNWPALVGLAVLVISLELQVRVVEEPYLLKVHGERYASYAAAVGRFLPGVGRLR
jgi:protein-S-isoprenylcysteine O-methyltransferase Ste14